MLFDDDCSLVSVECLCLLVSCVVCCVFCLCRCRSLFFCCVLVFVASRSWLMCLLVHVLLCVDGRWLVLLYVVGWSCCLLRVAA